ncbi:hypothetical protein [Aureimonas sp. SK2]|uniref:hypothetical protein n=1 Tax=Aureimonas sp. SK2 TaxID=3015992 RepID=UPI0024449C4C|nr:hypothetical protein [Aureimonas sp. SK2]
MSTKLSNDVEVELGGETHLLRANLKNATAISRQFGGFDGAVQGLLNSNLDVYQSIVKTGIVTAKNISTDDLKEMVWSAGMNKLVVPLSKFVGMCRNGGRDPETEDDQAPDEGQAGNGAAG